jgi:hypothetical protein
MASRMAPATKKAYVAAPSARPAEDLLKFQQDLNILSQKLADLQQQQQLSSSAGTSSFVAGLRTSVEGERMVEGSDKISMLESILAKIVEVDRQVLRITGE